MLVALLGALCAGAPGMAADVVAATSAELIERADAFDGRIVASVGEAIGEPMFRDGHAWLHLNDAPYPERVVEQGGSLSGFNAACREHGGDTDIHAISVEVLASGRTIPHEPHRGRIAAVPALGVLVVALTAAERRRSARERVGLDARRPSRG